MPTKRFPAATNDGGHNERDHLHELFDPEAIHPYPRESPPTQLLTLELRTPGFHAPRGSARWPTWPGSARRRLLVVNSAEDAHLHGPWSRFAGISGLHQLTEVVQGACTSDVPWVHDRRRPHRRGSEEVDNVAGSLTTHLLDGPWRESTTFFTDRCEARHLAASFSHGTAKPRFHLTASDSSVFPSHGSPPGPPLLILPSHFFPWFKRSSHALSACSSQSRLRA